MYACKQRRKISLGLCLLLAVGATSGGFAYPQDPDNIPPPAVQDAIETPQQLQQLVAPIALYPDALVAQILAAATYPTQVVEADRWMKQNSGLSGDNLAQQVNQQPWDPSVQALTQFPSVLDNLDKNLSWTSALGDAYVNQPQDVMNAVQVMRQRARKAGHLKSSAQETVTNDGSTIIIQPTNPDVVYVPEYDPWGIYGAPIAAYPYWDPVAGLYIGGPGISFGVGFGIGLFAGFGWGWHHWDADWHHHAVYFDHHNFVSHSPTFGHRNDFNHGNPGGRNGFSTNGGRSNADFTRPARTPGNSGVSSPAVHNYTPPRNTSPFNSGSPHPSALSGYDHGATVRGYSARGQSSLGGGFHPAPSAAPRGGGGGGGGFHGGGGHR